VPGPEPAFSVYEELTRLNNDLGAAQRELARKNAELERLNAQKNQFLGMAAHDLRNPLGVILNYSDFLLDDPGAAFSTEQRAFLEIIRSSSDFMLRLVNDLLDVSLIEAGRLELDRKPVDLGRLTARAVGLNRLLAERKSILLSLSDAEDGPTLALDAGKIEQVLNNLITNAIKFSHAGTTVSVSVRRRGGAAEVAVADEGQGIPAAERERLFRPFGRTSVQPTAGEQSTGLGLSICRRIVEGHGGRIWAESQEGRGSTFTFALPLPDRADDTPPAPPLPAPAPAARRGLGVLVAEDQPVNQKMLARLLGEMGHRVTLAADGRRALEALGSEPFDVVLMDLQMPEMDGFAAVAALRARERRDGGHVPVIALTGQDGPEERPRCLAAGFDGFLAKPVRADALRALLDAMEGRGNGGEDPDATAPGPGGDADGDDDDGRSRPHPRRRRGGRGPGPDPGPDRR
ncbi:MAG TPA: hybrid sensor histidine kinase/response regulator, partial [Isosphaeraceae bacterium]|jgi:CheY-like chemotaxis protein/nitrogen-specific signal transduction histidine kinase